MASVGRKFIFHDSRKKKREDGRSRQDWGGWSSVYRFVIVNIASLRAFNLDRQPPVHGTRRVRRLLRYKLYTTCNLFIHERSSLN